MKLSYWDIKSWLSHIDFCIVGSGIVGLSCALQLKLRYPKSKILVLEKGILPQGASTKNAGFACFGSLSELLNDLKSHSEDEVIKLVTQRVEGLTILRKTLGDTAIRYQQFGGYELFAKTSPELYETCLSKKEEINILLKPVFKDNVFSVKSNIFKFQNIQEHNIFNPFEGQIDTGCMMEALLHKVQVMGVKILNSIEVKAFSEDQNAVHIETNLCTLSASKLLIATNGFTSQLIQEKVKPARAQVLITTQIPNLNIKGSFHLDEGYYYFRNIDNRILLGGGRNLDFKGEETFNFGETELIQSQLEHLLKTVILPTRPFEIEQRWSGIMGLGSQKRPIVKPLGNRVYCGVRLGGMGVAIGGLIGADLANLIT
ncbi:FAD-binding oxidoreductase [Tamlana fucoidanivorans]|uniref:FAD-binding oxidoreductase n=1 Tax=Allotamlana fucoidanivorans TaxID=2583814 RepID=A0A5C4ST13_9FLAO|nr:FAD-dependent oxidoreductase [Tamlana fucoidanivorans]TNJ47137.1 FAD-binding oxidoreductase [Tamlana fucoidanivorans]